MDNMELYRSIGALDDELLDRSEQAKKPQKLKWVFAAAACLCLIVGTVLAVGLPGKNVGSDPPHLPGGLAGNVDETNPPAPTPPDHNHLLCIDDKYYMVTEARASLPDGYSVFREVTEEEQCGTGLAGYKLYIDAKMEDIWLYQPADTVVEKAYTGGLPELPDGTTDYPEWVYTHWEPAPKPAEREPEPENWPTTTILPNEYPEDAIAPTEETEPDMLSALSKEEQLNFLKEKGIDVPEYAEDYIIKLIHCLEEDPDHPLGISNPVVVKLGEAVREAVNEYYGR